LRFALLAHDLVGPQSGAVLAGALTLRVSSFVVVSSIAGVVADRVARNVVRVGDIGEFDLDPADILTIGTLWLGRGPLLPAGGDSVDYRVAGAAILIHSLGVVQDSRHAGQLE
jgi:hypothetical protein